MPAQQQAVDVARKHMASLYTYINSADFIDNLQFEYAETYSLQRGLDYEQNMRLLRFDYDRLKIRKENSDLTQSEEDQFFQLNELFGFTQYVLNDKGQFHPSSKRTNTFSFNDPMASRLTNILRQKQKRYQLGYVHQYIEMQSYFIIPRRRLFRL